MVCLIFGLLCSSKKIFKTLFLLLNDIPELFKNGNKESSGTSMQSSRQRSKLGFLRPVQQPGRVLDTFCDSHIHSDGLRKHQVVLLTTP